MQNTNERMASVSFRFECLPTQWLKSKNFYNPGLHCKYQLQLITSKRICRPLLMLLLLSRSKMLMQQLIPVLKQM